MVLQFRSCYDFMEYFHSFDVLIGIVFFCLSVCLAVSLCLLTSFECKKKEKKVHSLSLSTSFVSVKKMCMVVFHFFFFFFLTNFLSYILLFVCLFYELFFLLYLICLCACKCIQLSTYLPIYTSLSLSFWKMNGYIKTGKFEKRQEVGFNMSTIFGTTTFIEGLFLTADFIYLLILDSFKQLAPPPPPPPPPFPNLLLFSPLFSFWVCQMKLRSPPPTQSYKDSLFHAYYRSE